MATYHCPKCDIIFQDENQEMVFCPQCQITLAARVEDESTLDIDGPSFNRRWDLLICGILILAGALYIAWKLTGLSEDLMPGLIIMGVVLGGIPKFFNSLLTDAGKHRIKRFRFAQEGEAKPATTREAWFLGGIICVNILIAEAYVLFALAGALMGGPLGVLIHLGITFIILMPAIQIRCRYLIKPMILLVSYLLPLLLFALFWYWLI